MKGCPLDFGVDDGAFRHEAFHSFEGVPPYSQHKKLFGGLLYINQRRPNHRRNSLIFIHHNPSLIVPTTGRAKMDVIKQPHAASLYYQRMNKKIVVIDL